MVRKRETQPRQRGPQSPKRQAKALEAEVDRLIAEDSKSAAPDRPASAPAPIPATPSMPEGGTFASSPDIELDDEALAAAIFVPPVSKATS